MSRRLFTELKALIHPVVLFRIHVPDQRVEGEPALLGQVERRRHRGFVRGSFGQKCFFTGEHEINVKRRRFSMGYVHKNQGQSHKSKPGQDESWQWN